jgi:hypothetical protein
MKTNSVELALTEGFKEPGHYMNTFTRACEEMKTHRKL